MKDFITKLFCSFSMKTLKGRFRALFFASVIIFSLVLPSAFSSLVFGDDYIVNDFDVNIRSGPGVEYQVIGSAAYSQNVKATGEEYDAEGNLWLAVDLEGETGYVRADYLEAVSSDNGMEEESSVQNQDDPAGLPVAEDPVSEELKDQEQGPEPLSDDKEKEPEDPDAEKESETETSEDEAETEENTDIVSEEMYDLTEEEIMMLNAPGDQPGWSGHIQSEAEFEAQLSRFPESYRAGLRAVHAVYPNYTFTADIIDMDFQTLVDKEAEKKISAYYSPSWKAMYDESFGRLENYNWETGEWYNSEGLFTYASREVIEHYVDPRNFLDPSNIYMFMRQSYSPDHTVDDLRSIIEGSYLANGYIPVDEPNDQRLKGDYAAVIMEAAERSGMSPFVLAASIILEHGYQGGTPLISGYYKADDGTVYINYFNYFDIGATGTDSNNVIQNGLEYAKAKGWNSRYLSIVNGAIWTADSYIKAGQDTYYYKEFNVTQGWDSLWHQYSTGILTAYVSSSLMRDALSANKYAVLDFRIPVYQNMPASPAEEPLENDNLNNYYFTDMQAQGLTPEFSMANRDYSMTVTGDTTLSITLPKWATYESGSSFPLNRGTNTVKLNVRSQTGYLRTYNITVNAKSQCTLYIDIAEGARLGISGGNDSAGDANGDGKVSALDYIAIKNHIMDIKKIQGEANIKNADANGDGKISALDYIAIKNHIMSK